MMSKYQCNLFCKRMKSLTTSILYKYRNNGIKQKTEKVIHFKFEEKHLRNDAKYFCDFIESTCEYLFFFFYYYSSFLGVHVVDLVIPILLVLLPLILIIHILIVLNISMHSPETVVL